MQETQQKSPFTQPPTYGVTFPEGERPRVSLYNRDSLTRACQGNERMASVLDYFLFEGSWEIDRQKLPEGCKVVEFIRKHAQILKRLTFNLSRKSLIGYLDTLNAWGFVNSEKFHNHYIVHFDTVQAAIDEPPATKERKSRTRKGCKVEAITTEDNASTLVQKVELLQRKVEELQRKVELLQPLGCNSSTLQPAFNALVEMLQGHFPEVSILLNCPLLSSTTQESDCASAQSRTSPADFLPADLTDEECAFAEDDNPTRTDLPTPQRVEAVKKEDMHGTNAATSTRDIRRAVTSHHERDLLFDALRTDGLPEGESQLLQGTDGTPEAIAIASTPGEPAIPPTAHARQSHTTSLPLSDGAATEEGSEPRPSREQQSCVITQEKPALLSLTEDEPHIKPETPVQRKRRIEQRANEIWTLVEAQLETRFSRTQRQSAKNKLGMQNLIEDETDDKTIKKALEALDDFYKRQFNLKQFHELMPGLLAPKKSARKLADKSQNVRDVQYEAALQKIGQPLDGEEIPAWLDFDNYVGNGPEERKRWREEGDRLKALGFCPDL